MKFYPPVRVLVILLTVSAASVAQTLSHQLALNPQELVRRTVENEIKANTDGAKFMFRDRKQTPRGSETKLLVETQQATAGLVIARNDHPLNTEELQSEKARVQRFIDNPSELARKADREKEDTEHTIQIMRALPDAFVYEADGAEPGRNGIGKSGDELVRLQFRPNPHYHPPSHVEQVLTGMEGYLLIDARQNRIAKIDGTLFKDVEFGWGFLGRLDHGGRFIVEQGDEGEGQWEITRMNLGFHGKILLVKSLAIQSEEVFSEFHRVPSDLTFEQGLRMLEAQQGDLANNTLPTQN